MKRIDFITDSGFILKDIKYESTFFLDDPHIIYYGKRDYLIAKLVIQGKPLGKSVFRSYIKLQDALTNIGGILEIFIYIGSKFANLSSSLIFVNDFIFNIEVKKSNIRSRQQLPPENLPKINNLMLNKSQGFLMALEPKLGPDLSPNKSSKLSVLRAATLLNTNSLYSKWSILKDYLNLIFCLFRRNNDFYKQRKRIEVMFNKLLSIELLLEKMYFLELLINRFMNEEEQLKAYSSMFNQIAKESSSPQNIFAFGNEGDAE